jgi:hypothetical protein
MLAARERKEHKENFDSVFVAFLGGEIKTGGHRWSPVISDLRFKI